MDVFSTLGAAGSGAYDNLGLNDGGPSAAATTGGTTGAGAASSVTASDPAADALAPDVEYAPSPAPAIQAADEKQLSPGVRYAPSPAPHLAGFDRSA